ncbi:MAG: rod shape-determining protein MreC [Caldimonas sp.]|uniref:rod shape-determining protein MreC n=1 Tax=Caldimonas TaxID=196013 RepID=UPI0003672CE8|nr:MULTISPECIES: rod shape-determining protein MreC [Caldimonas]GIX24689.1 MAG: rod shape-determining protein MreC [Caldimonas sp.]
MPLGTLDRTPPPFFRQGPSAFTRLIVFSALALFLMVADRRLSVTEPLRAVIATALHPVQQVLLMPVQAISAAGQYLQGLAAARAAEAQARRQLADQAVRLSRLDLLEQENARLRELLQLRSTVSTRTLAAEVLYDRPDPYTRKVVIDRGLTQGVVPGSPVIDPTGVIGQVTRVYPLTSEVTLLVDKDAVIPVLNTRTQVRGLAYGDPQRAGLELRFMPTNADVREGDTLATSGVDGVYPAGLPVAVVSRVERRADSAFARILLEPVGQLDSARHVLVLEPVGHALPPPPEPASEALPRSQRRSANGR